MAQAILDGYAAASSANQVVTAIGQDLLKLGPELLMKYVNGESFDMSKLSPETRLALKLAKQLVDQLGEKLANMTEEEHAEAIGRIFGIVLYEVAEAFSPAAAVKGAKAIKLPNLIKKLDFIPGSKQVIDEWATGLGRLLNTKMCFVAGTPIHTLEGLKNIEDIQIGDMVLTRPDDADETHAKSEYKPVLELFTTHPGELLHITYRTPEGDEETLSTTGPHPFFVVDSREFVDASDLRVGQTLSLPEGRSANVTRITREHAKPGAPFTTYNFEVEEYHTYFAGKLGAWVHNLSNPVCKEMQAQYDDIIKAQQANGGPIDTAAARKEVMEWLDAQDLPDHLKKQHRQHFDEIVFAGRRPGVDYGNIPDEHIWRYNRYLDDPTKGTLSPNNWYDAAKRAWANNPSGNGFEFAVRQSIGSPLGRGSKPVSIEGFVPDLPVGTRYGVTEVKNWEKLYADPQLVAFGRYALANDLPFNLIISPNTKEISEPLLRMIRNSGGKVFEYDPSTGKYSTINIGNRGRWKR